MSGERLGGKGERKGKVWRKIIENKEEGSRGGFRPRYRVKKS